MSAMDGLDRVGLLGGGVIGGGWAARFLLNGVDVVMYDPDPEAERSAHEEVLAQIDKSSNNKTVWRQAAAALD